jgi:single-strand DNA-binding protein
MRILDFLKSGALVELTGTPFAKAYPQEDGTVKTEIRLNISKTNILRPSKNNGSENDDYSDVDDFSDDLDDFTLGEDEF